MFNYKIMYVCTPTVRQIYGSYMYSHKLHLFIQTNKIISLRFMHMFMLHNLT